MLLLLLSDRNLAIRSATVCVYVVGCKVNISPSLCVYIISLFHLSVPLFCFRLAERPGADRLIEGRLKHGQTPNTAKLLLFV